MFSFSSDASNTPLIDSLWPGTLRVLILIYLSFAAYIWSYLAESTAVIKRTFFSLSCKKTDSIADCLGSESYL